jgi:hypothetical protein
MGCSCAAKCPPCACCPKKTTLCEAQIDLEQHNQVGQQKVHVITAKASVASVVNMKHSRKSRLHDLLRELGEPGGELAVGVHLGGEVVHVFIVDVGCRRRPRAGEPVYRDPVENCL